MIASDSEDESSQENDLNQSKIVQQMLEDRFIQELLNSIQNPVHLISPVKILGADSIS